MILIVKGNHYHKFHTIKPIRVKHEHPMQKLSNPNIVFCSQTDNLIEQLSQCQSWKTVCLLYFLDKHLHITNQPFFFLNRNKVLHQGDHLWVWRALFHCKCHSWTGNWNLRTSCNSQHWGSSFLALSQITRQKLILVWWSNQQLDSILHCLVFEIFITQKGSQNLSGYLPQYLIKLGWANFWV